MSKVSRAFALWRVLSKKPEGATLRELAERFGVSKNSIQRDLDELTVAGVQVVEERRGQTLRFRLAEELRGAPQLGARDEAALAAARETLKPYRETFVYRAFEEAVAKLSVEGKGSGTFAVRGPTGRVRPSVTAFSTLLEGILSQRRCVIRYRRRSDGKEKDYTVEPHVFLLHQGLLYLRARLPTQTVLTTFAAHLVLDATLTEERFVPLAASPPAHAFGVSEARPSKVRVRFTEAVAAYIHEREWHPSQRLRALPDGGVELLARVSGREEFVGWVMSWGDNAELLEPAEWRDEVRRRAAGILSAHREASAKASSRRRNAVGDAQPRGE